ncbi:MULTISPECIES: STAS domain-containing protein [Thiomicrorhabdus]|uniref:STAS domain-containing protein n=1 Tax=Thiomicrorhabdus heinhorstiae TaxID=2748010 RepID=A0ABS0BTR2_9GAMM|nr:MULTISPECIES: STAS domain-containing protein [Thiomicrorhabdus]MBF6057223.1 STAS domain-containing protein [Thiomicrorhabdus heinhorstiae]
MQIEWMPQSKIVVMPEEVTLKTLPGLLKAHSQWCDFAVETVDFSKVTHADSAVLALLLAWRTRASKPIRVKNLPDELSTLLGLYDLDDVLESMSEG